MSREQKKSEKEEPKQEAKAAEGQEAKKEEAKTVVLMKKGDYTIHVLIEEVKNCASYEGKDQLPVPIVKVTCLKKSERTKKPSLACSDLIIDEHFFFEGINLTTEMLDSEKIVIECYDNKHTKRQDYFGIYEFDFEYIYNQPYHALKNFWIALANPEGKSISEVRGYLKLSVSVLHEKDPRVELEMSEAAGTDCIIPSQIKMKYKQVSIYIFKAEELPDMDSMFFESKVNRECNAFVEVKYLGLTKMTNVVDMKNEMVSWNQIVDIPVSDPALSQKIVMTVKDKDPIGEDIVGSIELTINDIKNGKYENYRYVDIYGSSLNKKGKVFDLMNYNSEIGSKWKGRVLIRVTYTDVETPVSRVRPIDDPELIKTVAKLGRPNQWTIHYKLFSTYYLPEPKAKYGIRLIVQDKSSFQAPREAKDRNIEWNVIDSLQCNTLSADKDEVADLFIYLTKDKDNLCFQRIKASTFYQNKDTMVIKLIPDPCLGKVDSMMKSGIIKIKICMVHYLDKDFDVKRLMKGTGNQVFAEAPGKAPTVAPLEDDSDEDDLEKLTAKENARPVTQVQEVPKPKGKTYTVCACVYMSRYLIAGNTDGTSDPYVILTLGSIQNKTSVKTATINGVWNELLKFTNVELDLDDQSTWPIFLLNVMDENTISDTPLGYNYIWLSNSSYSMNETALIDPRWHRLFLPKSNKSQGQILMSFYIFDQEHENDIHRIKYIPETEQYTCEINILGLRQLKPLSMLPVKKPFIKFDMNGLNVTGSNEDSLQPIQTVPSDTGENPTINTVIKFDAKLPGKEIFIPDLQCEVYDHLLNGLMNSLLGVFVLHTKRIINSTHRQIEEDLSVMKRKFGMNLNEGLIKNKFLPIGGQSMVKADTFKEQKSKDEIPQDEDISVSHNINKKLEMSVTMALNEEDRPHATGLYQLQSDDLTKEVLFDNKDNSKFFVIFPVTTQYKIPGYKKDADAQVQGEAGQPQIQGEPQGEEGNDAEKCQKDFVIEDESRAPDNNLFFKIGYLLKTQEEIPKNREITKHYRRIYREPLERVKELKLKSPFLKSDLKRGKYEDKRNEIGLFEAMSNINGKIIKRYDEQGIDENRNSIVSVSSGHSSQLEAKSSEEKYYGKFKGVIRICRKDKMEEYRQCIESFKGNDNALFRDFKNLNNYANLRKKILAKKSVVIRVYILEINNLAKKDTFSESDPYVIIKAGKTVINESKFHQNDMKNCKWYKAYDIPAELPGTSTLDIQVWDFDDLLSDDMIGNTVIDLEDRYFDAAWQDLVEKPIEVRQIYHPDIHGSQGEVSLWVEILESTERSEFTPWKITPEPNTELEVRFIVWETEDMEMMDVEGTSDIYINAYIDQKDKCSTDCHYRCQTGAASFNWRMLMPMILPHGSKVLTLQVYDRDLFASDDYISGATLDISKLITVPKLLEIPIKFTRDYYNGLNSEEKAVWKDKIQFESSKDDPEGIKFWVQCSKNEKNKAGRVLCSLEILPKAKADMMKVGKGREEPNLAPYLPPPFGRLEFTLNPCKMIAQCVGPKFRRKVVCWLCLCLLVIYLVCMIPYVILNFSGEVVLKPFK